MVREYLVTMTGTVTEAIQACTFPGAARQPVGTEMGIDTCTPMGKAMAHIAVVFAELERDLIRMRTYPCGALQVKEENGVMLGRSRSTPPKRSVVLQVSNVLG
jgi:hypothetical protein